MTNDNDRMPEPLASLAREYNAPPELSSRDLDQMWNAIEKDAFPRRFTSPSAERAVPGANLRGAAIKRWVAPGNLLPLAAVLVLGVAIGRFALPRKVAVPPRTAVAVRAAAPDSVAVPEPYQSTTSRYLGQTAALLVALPAEVNAGRADKQFMGRAHDLLLTTRLLLDTPAAADPRFRSLLEDLELVLVQVVRLQSDQGGAELDLIRQALEQRDVLPRLRTAVADISADD